jgi:hypothetical protein
VCVLTTASPVFSQHRVDARLTYERLWCVLPLIGTGTLADPKRPLYAPLPAAMNAASRTGIIGFTFVFSDDGKFALVEFVARDRSAFQNILADVATSVTSKAFLKGQSKREDVEAEFKKQKKDFDFNSFGVRMP